jgi:type VI secretion system protein ImpK
MTPDVAKAIDPIFEYVLGLLDRIELGDEPADPRQTLSYIHTRLLPRAEEELSAKYGPQWRLAKYALVCWIDELLTRTHWSGREWWISNPLEFLLFQTGDGAILFYVNAKQAVGQSTADALEVFYLCVILGFRGIYEKPEEHGLDIAANDLPPNVEEWLRRTGEGIRLSPLAGPAISGRQPAGAPPLGGMAFLTSALILFVIAAAGFATALLLRWSPTTT